MRLAAVFAAMLLAAPAGAADWYAAAGWGWRLDDQRVLREPIAGAVERFAPWTQAVLPACGIVAAPLGMRFEAGASGRLEIGAPVPGEGMGPLRRGSAAEAHADLRREFASGMRFSAQGEASRSHDLLDVDHATASADADVARWAASAAADARWVTGEYGIRGWRSAEASPGDARSIAWGVHAFFVRATPVALYASGRERMLQHERENALKARIGALGFQRAILPGITAAIEVGAVEEQIGFQREAPRAAAAIELTSSPGRARAAGDLRLRVAHELGEEYELEVGRRAGRARAWVSASSTVDLDGAGSSPPAVIDRAALGAVDTLGGNVLGLECSAARARPYRGIAIEQRQSVRAGAWLERRVQPWLTCRAGWDVLQRHDGVASVLRRSRFELQVRAHAR